MSQKRKIREQKMGNFNRLYKEKLKKQKMMQEKKGKKIENLKLQFYF